ncbi:MAG: DNA translocase FtsK 4TM domain-containing protein [Bacteroidaceae bacterium]|nr:DNA translocase FtsK 4TM domain-containing protein [Bacteroidaceae bacterium]
MAKNTYTSSKKKTSKRRTSDTDIMSKAAITKFIIGITLVFIALFMIIAFSSFLYSGASDYSIVDTQNFNDFYYNLIAQNRGAKNICGAFGALTAYTFINRWFGLAAYFIPVFLILLGLKLIGSFRIRIIRIFILMGILMAWLSLLLGALTISIPSLGDNFYYLGGYSGTQIVKWCALMIGLPGVYGVLALIAIFILLYLSSRTIDVIRSMIRLERIKRIGNPLSSLWHHGDDEEDIETEDDPDRFEDPVTHVIDLTDKTSLPQDPGLPQGGEPAGQTPAEPVNLVEQPKPGAAEQVAIDFDVVAGKSTPTATTHTVPDIKRGDISMPYDPKLSLEHYKYPTLSLLEKGEDNGPAIDMDEQKANKDRIIQVLHSFGVEISSIKATIGPTITLYEITPAEGMRISRIRNLEDDIALSLAAEGIRIIAPIPGKGTIGIEVPNKKKCTVSMESVLNSKTYQETKMELPCALGKTITNEVFMIDLTKAPHMLVAGATGMGKSVGLNAIVTSLLYKKHPSELKIVMVDPKKVEFSVYNPIENHFLAKLEEEEEPIITDVQKVVKTLNSLCKLMDTRYDLLKAAGVRNIKEYNEAFKARKLNPMLGHDFMPYYVVIIDEFGDLIMTAGKEIELPICRIAQLARAVGIHMIIATQRPTAQIITGTIKANFPARVAFRVAAMMDSRIILDRPGANQLIGRGDMLYLNGGDPTRVQCAFVDTPEVSRICKFISSQQSFGHAAYLPEVDDDSEGGGDSGELAGRLDPMFEECAKLVVSSQQGSTSMLQRNFSIGYNRAGKIMDQLQKAGIVGAQVGAKPRDVLVQDFNTLETIINNLR